MSYRTANKEKSCQWVNIGPHVKLFALPANKKLKYLKTHILSDASFFANSYANTMKCLKKINFVNYH